MRGSAALLVLAGLLHASPAAADSEADAVSLATNAFEYRDFKKVIDVLTPWLHPPRITNRDLRITARRLLGVSLHVQGDVAGAREEFSQLLLEDPLHKLDPFVVPPPVIETFEAVRREMKPTLDRILKERGQKVEVDDTPKKVMLVPAASPYVAFAPLGFPQFQLDEPGLGLTFGSIQAIAFVLNIVAYARAKSIHDSGGNDNSWLVVQYGSLGACAGAWALSAVLGNLGLPDYNRRLLKEPPKTAGPPAGLFTLSF